MVKVVHVFYSFGMGGAEMQAYKLCQASNGSHKIWILSNSYLSFIENQGLKKENFISVSLKHKNQSFELLKYIISYRNETVFVSWLYKADVLMGFSRLFLRFSWYISVRTHKTRKGVLSFFGKRIISKLSYLSKGVIYNSSIARDYHRGLNFSMQNDCIIYNGFPVDKVIRSNNLENKSIVFLGRMHEDKGIDLFVNFIIDHRIDLFNKGYKVYIAGITHNEFYKVYPHLNDLQNLKVVGQVDPYIFLQDKEFLILPSRRESMPNVVIEGLLIGLKILASNVGDLMQVFPKEIMYINPYDTQDIWYKLNAYTIATSLLERDEWDISTSFNRFNQFLCVEY